jgi:Fe-S oxidoreductase
MPRMQALKEVEQSNGVDTLVAICAICKSQFSKVLPKYDFDPYMIVSLHQLVSEAIILDKPEKLVTEVEAEAEIVEDAEK